MRVSILVTDTRRGGTPTRMADLGRGLAARGAAVQFVSLMPAGEVLAELPEDVETVDLGMRSLPHLAGAGFGLRRALKRFRPDVLQAALFHANVVGRLVGKSVSVPVVSGYQSVDDRMPRARVVVDRLTAPLAVAHVAVSQAAAARAAQRLRIPQERIDVVPIGKKPPNLIDRQEARRRFGLPADAFVVGFVGRLHPVKDLATLARAVDLLPGQPFLLVAGDGSERARLEGRPRTVMTGMLADVGPALSAMDVFVLPSRWEGMPGALVEAMAAGLSVVATNVGGVPEVVTHGVDGLLVPPGDAVAMSDAITAASGRPDLGKAALAASGRFTLEAMVAGYERVYRRVLNPT